MEHNMKVLKESKLRQAFVQKVDALNSVMSEYLPVECGTQESITLLASLKNRLLM